MAKHSEMSPETQAAKKLPSKKELRADLAKYTEEYRWLGPEASAGHGPAIARRHELAKLMNDISKLLFLREPIVEVSVPALPRGTKSSQEALYRIGDQNYLAGQVYKVHASVAQYLLYMIDQRRRNEIARLQQNGMDMDLGAIGEKARYEEIQREV